MTSATTAATAPAEAKATKKATEYRLVEMTDGRKVEFPGKRKMLKFSGKDDATGQLYVRLDFDTGDTRTFEIPQVDIEKYACHGAEQKYGDETAGLDNVDDMLEAVDALGQRLTVEHAWNQVREPGESFSGAGDVIKGMCQVTGKAIDDIKKYIEAKLAEANKDVKEGEKAVLSRQGLYKAIRASAKFGPAIAAIEAKRASKIPDLDFSDVEETPAT